MLFRNRVVRSRSAELEREVGGMPRRTRDRNPADMSRLSNLIKETVAERKRKDPRYSRAAFARECGLSASVVSDIVNHPDRDVEGLTLVRLARGLRLLPQDVFHIAYPTEVDEAALSVPLDEEKRARLAEQLRRRADALLDISPEFARVRDLLPLVPLEQRGRVLGFVEAIVTETLAQREQSLTNNNH